MTHTMFGKSRRSEEHTSELQSRLHIVCRLLLEKKKQVGYLDNPIVSGNRQLISTDHHSVAILFSSNLTALKLQDQILNLRQVALTPCFASYVTGTPAHFFDDQTTTEIYTLSLHDALPISAARISSRALLGP